MQRYLVNHTEAGPLMLPDYDGNWYSRSTVDARISALESRLAAMTKDRDAQAEAVRVLAMGVLAGQMARACLRGCPSTSGCAGGQTIGEGLSRMRFHQVPLSIFDHLYGAEEMIHDNPIAAAAVKGEKES